MTELPPASRPRAGWAGVATRAAVVGVVAGLLVGCASGTSHHAPDRPSGARASGSTVSTTEGANVATPALPDCGRLPTSSGPASTLATITLTAPASAPSGSTMRVSATLRTSADGGRIIATPATSDVLILRAGRVVGRSAPRSEALPVPVPLQQGRARPVQAIPATVRMAGCPVGPDDAARPSLPAGQYTLVGVLGYHLDALNNAVDSAPPSAGQTGFSLVSEPVPITIT